MFIFSSWQESKRLAENSWRRCKWPRDFYKDWRNEYLRIHFIQNLIYNVQVINRLELKLSQQTQLFKNYSSFFNKKIDFCFYLIEKWSDDLPSLSESILNLCKICPSKLFMPVEFYEISRQIKNLLK